MGDKWRLSSSPTPPPPSPKEFNSRGVEASSYFPFLFWLTVSFQQANQRAPSFIKMIGPKGRG